MNDKQRVFLRVSVHDVGGRSYQAEAEVRLEREGRSTRFTKAEGAAYAEGHVEPGVYGLVVLAGDLTSPRQQVVVGPEGKTTSAYLGQAGLAVLPAWGARGAVRAASRPARGRFPFGQAGPGGGAAAGRGDRGPGESPAVPLPSVDEQKYPGEGARAGDADAGSAAVWLFQFADAPSPEDPLCAAAAIREIVGDRARVGVPVDLRPGQAKVVDNRFVIRFRDGVDPEAVRRLVDEAGARVLRHFRQSRNAYLVELPDGDILANLATVEEWAGRDLLVYGEPDVMAQITDGVFPDTRPPTRLSPTRPT